MNDLRQLMTHQVLLSDYDYWPPKADADGYTLIHCPVCHSTKARVRHGRLTHCCDCLSSLLVYGNALYYSLGHHSVTEYLANKSTDCPTCGRCTVCGRK